MLHVFGTQSDQGICLWVRGEGDRDELVLEVI